MTSQPRTSLTPLLGQQVCLCVDNATVTTDDREPTPRSISGCIVGEFLYRGGWYWLRGFSFVTRVSPEVVRGAWPRDEAPSPCPHCGYVEKPNAVA